MASCALPSSNFITGFFVFDSCNSFLPAPWPGESTPSIPRPFDDASAPIIISCRGKRRQTVRRAILPWPPRKEFGVSLVMEREQRCELARTEHFLHNNAGNRQDAISKQQAMLKDNRQQQKHQNICTVASFGILRMRTGAASGLPFYACRTYMHRTAGRDARKIVSKAQTSRSDAE